METAEDLETAHTAELFYEMDADKDGAVSLAELIAGYFGEEFNVENIEEHSSDFFHVFNDADTDGNEKLGKDEMSLFYHKMAEFENEQPDEERDEVEGEEAAKEFMSELDVNKDGKLSLAEIFEGYFSGAAEAEEEEDLAQQKKQLEKLFRDADTDEDGELEQREMVAFLVSMEELELDDEDAEEDTNVDGAEEGDEEEEEAGDEEDEEEGDEEGEEGEEGDEEVNHLEV